MEALLNLISAELNSSSQQPFSKRFSTENFNNSLDKSLPTEKNVKFHKPYIFFIIFSPQTFASNDRPQFSSLSRTIPAIEVNGVWKIHSEEKREKSLPNISYAKIYEF